MRRRVAEKIVRAVVLKKRPTLGWRRGTLLKAKARFDRLVAAIDTQVPSYRYAYDFRGPLTYASRPIMPLSTFYGWAL